MQNHISSLPIFWLVIALFSIQGVVIYVTHNPPPFSPNHTAASPAAARAPIREAVVSNEIKAENASRSNGQKCTYGQVYVYDLSSMFNEDLLLHNCTDLHPHNWQCGIVTNHGFGGPAAELLGNLPENLHESWYRTNQFSLELIFHRRILQHECRTMEAESAAAFYIPFYGGLAVGKHLWSDDVDKRDWLCDKMLEWVTKQKYWKTSNGSDHFLALGRITWDFRRLTDPEKKWGSKLLNVPVMRNVSRFIIEKFLDEDHDIGVPYPTGFHPKTRRSLGQWQDFVRAYNRTRLFTFAGARRPSKRNDIREILHTHCSNESDYCWPVDCGVEQCASDTWVTLKALLGSDFCLQPTGDSATRKSVFDCMVAGSVPVFFSSETAYDQYEGFLPGEPESYSVYIDHEGVQNGSMQVKQVLIKYGREEIKRKREKVIGIIPRIIYGDPSGGLLDFRDAFDIAVDGVLERIKEDKEWAGFL